MSQYSPSQYTPSQYSQSQNSDRVSEPASHTADEMLFDAEAEACLSPDLLSPGLIEPGKITLQDRRWSDDSLVSAYDLENALIVEGEEEDELCTPAEVHRLTLEGGRLREERQKWHNRFQAAKVEVDRLDIELVARDQANAELRRENLQQEQRITELEEALKRVKNDDQLVAQVAELKEHLGRATTTIRDAELEFETKNSEQQAKLNEQDVEITWLRKRVFALEQSNSTLLERLRKVRTEMGIATPGSPPWQPMPTGPPPTPPVTPEKSDKASHKTSSDPPMREPLETTHTCPDPIVHITINLTAPQKPSLIHRLTSAMTKTAHLHIDGPEPHVANLRANMEQLESDHAAQTVLAAKWEKAANASAAEIEKMKIARPECSISGHRNLVDELAAKNLQFMMQEQLLAEIRRRDEERAGRRSGEGSEGGRTRSGEEWDLGMRSAEMSPKWNGLW